MPFVSIRGPRCRDGLPVGLPTSSERRSRYIVQGRLVEESTALKCLHLQCVHSPAAAGYTPPSPAPPALASNLQRTFLLPASLYLYDGARERAACPDALHYKDRPLTRTFPTAFEAHLGHRNAVSASASPGALSSVPQESPCTALARTTLSRGVRSTLSRVALSDPSGLSFLLLCYVPCLYLATKLLVGEVLLWVRFWLIAGAGLCPDGTLRRPGRSDPVETRGAVCPSGFCAISCPSRQLTADQGRGCL